MDEQLSISAAGRPDADNLGVHAGDLGCLNSKGREAETMGTVGAGLISSSPVLHPRLQGPSSCLPRHLAAAAR